MFFFSYFLKINCTTNRNFIGGRQKDSFAHQFRDILATLRFTRGPYLSIQKLIETIPTFNVRLQEDAGEFFTNVLSQLQEKLENPPEIES
jgi:ubiquitin C-terminal hydrolase